MVESYSLTIRIEIGTNEAKKNAVRDAVVTMLNNAKTAGNIVSAIWSVSMVPISEGGSI